MPKAKNNYPKRVLQKLYISMLRIRLCEESLVGPIRTGEIRCPVHLYSGEEAVAAGVCKALGQKDYVFSTHRSHGHYIAKGGRINELIAEVYGRETGSSRGRGGSMHLVDRGKGILGSAPIVAGTIPLAVGAALTAKIRKDGRVVVSFFGDGATGEGVLYESLNFAALNKLPIIFACENNFYSTHMPIREYRPNEKIADIANPFGITTRSVDGNNVLKVFEASCRAVFQCRSGLGPVFIEFLTYRLRGHVGPDDEVQGNRTDIRPPKEIADWRRRDPIARLRRYILRHGIFDRNELTTMETQIAGEVRCAHEFARRCPHPDPKELTEYVFRE